MVYGQEDDEGRTSTSHQKGFVFINLLRNPKKKLIFVPKLTTRCLNDVRILYKNLYTCKDAVFTDGQYSTLICKYFCLY